MRSVKPISSSASPTLKSTWNATTTCCSATPACGASAASLSRNGSTSSAPSTRDSRLPSVARRAAWLDDGVVASAATALPILAPSTIANATLTDTAAEVASVAQNSTTARLE